jgi:hypothetical protein
MFEKRRALELVENLRVFWSLEAGVMREDDIPRRVGHKNDSDGRRGATEQAKRIKQLRGFLSRKDESLERLRHQLAEMDRELKELRAAGPGGGLSREDVPIFFVVGQPRSGTNWLMRTLNFHPEILCRGEGRFFGRHSRHENLKDMETTEQVRFKVQPSSLQNALWESEYLRLWIERSVWTRDGDPEEHLRRFTRTAVYHFMREKLAQSDKNMVGDKTPLGNTKIITEIAEICPEARVIHIIRDGRDVAVSRTHHVWNRSEDEGGIYELTREERDKRDRYREDPQAFIESGESIFTERLIREISRRWNFRVGTAYRDGPALLGDHYLEVRYERLLERPEEEVRGIFEFLRARADAKLVSRCVEAASFEKRTGGRQRGQEDTHSGARKGISGDWKKVFTDRDREIFKEEAGDLLVELGYEKDRDW